MTVLVLAAVAIGIAAPARADTLRLALTETAHDIEQEWVLEDVSPGAQAPLTARAGDGTEVRLEITATLLGQDMVQLDLVISERAAAPEGGEPPPWAVVSRPRIQVLAGRPAAVRVGRETPDGEDYVEVELQYDRPRRF